MSGWIKFEKDVESDPRTQRMARALAQRFEFTETVAESNVAALCNACALPGVTLVCGALTRLWSFADAHARDDDTLDMGAAEIDAWLGIPGFCALMPADWLRIIDDHTVELPNFQAHNGTEAKKRALTQKRVARMRKDQQRTSVTGRNASALPDQDQTKTKKRPKEKRDDQSNVSHPVGINLDAWVRWLEYRKSIGKAIKPASAQAAIDELAKFGKDQAAVVQQSIANGWQGLFPLKSANGAAAPSTPRLTRFEQMKRALDAATMTDEEDAAHVARIAAQSQ